MHHSRTLDCVDPSPPAAAAAAAAAALAGEAASCMQHFTASSAWDLRAAPKLLVVICGMHPMLHFAALRTNPKLFVVICGMHPMLHFAALRMLRHVFM
jgi:hypothetical protein